MQAENAILFIWRSLTPQKICGNPSTNPKWSEFQFDLVLELLMLLGFMRVASLEEWHIFQASVWTLMEIVCFYEIKPLTPCLRLFSNQNLYILSGKSLTENQTEWEQICFLNFLFETSCATFLLGMLFHGSGRISVICIWEVILCYLYPMFLSYVFNSCIPHKQ